MAQSSKRYKRHSIAQGGVMAAGDKIQVWEFGSDAVPWPAARPA
jgi:hypothetical protein